MRLGSATLFFGALLSLGGCALIGYTFDGYEPPGTSAGGASSATITSAASMGSEVGPTTAAGAGGSAGCLHFEGPTDIALTHPSKFLLVGDLSLDGLPDVIAGSNVGLTVLRNSVGGALSAVPSGCGGDLAISSLALADYDADTMTDLAMLTSTGLYICKNQGGMLSTLQMLPVPGGSTTPQSGLLAAGKGDASGGDPLAVIAGNALYLVTNGGVKQLLNNVMADNVTDLDLQDVDGDGVADYVGTLKSPSEVGILFGGEDPSSMGRPFLLPAVPARGGLADFNGDKAVDIVTTTSGVTGAFLLLNKGARQFEAAKPLGVGVPARGLAAADFNGDHKLDLAVSGDGAIVILLGNGDGTFRDDHIKLAGLPQSGVLRAADMDSDGNVDLIEGSDMTPAVRVFFNRCK